MFKVNNKNTRTMSFWCFYCELWAYFTHFSSVFADFEQVNVSWASVWTPNSLTLFLLIKPIFTHVGSLEIYSSTGEFELESRWHSWCYLKQLFWNQSNNLVVLFSNFFKMSFNSWEHLWSTVVSIASYIHLSSFTKHDAYVYTEYRKTQNGALRNTRNNFTKSIIWCVSIWCDKSFVFCFKGKNIKMRRFSFHSISI